MVPLSTTCVNYSYPQAAYMSLGHLLLKKLEKNPINQDLFNNLTASPRFSLISLNLLQHVATRTIRKNSILVVKIPF